jgi:hypothetical protein
MIKKFKYKKLVKGKVELSIIWICRKIRRENIDNKIPIFKAHLRPIKSMVMKRAKLENK